MTIKECSKWAYKTKMCSSSRTVRRENKFRAENISIANIFSTQANSHTLTPPLPLLVEKSDINKMGE